MLVRTSTKPYLTVCEFQVLYVQWSRVAPDTDLAGYPAAGYPANIFAGYPVSGRISG